MNKGERISRLVAAFAAEEVDPNQADIAQHPFYRAFSVLERKRYYEAHDVLRQPGSKRILPVQISSKAG
jgi:hypothetical protein